MHYIHLPVGPSMVTVAFRINEESLTIDLSLAFCAPGDHFSKKKGRAIAGGRLAAEKRVLSITFDPTKMPKSQIARYIYAWLSLDTKPDWVPSWADGRVVRFETLYATDRWLTMRIVMGKKAQVVHLEKGWVAKLLESYKE